MKEKINLILTDLDNYVLTMEQLQLLLEKLLYYYGEKDMSMFINFIGAFNSYFGALNRLIQNNKEEELNG
jgi:hypothetical protein